MVRKKPVAHIVISDNKLYVASNEALDNPIHILDSIIYALEPTAVTPLLPLPVTVTVIYIVILAAAFFSARANTCAEKENFCIP